MSFMKYISVKNALSLMSSLLLAALVGCGGGGGSPGTPAGTTTPTSTTNTNTITAVVDPAATATLTVTGFAIFLEKPSILNDGVDKSNITVVAVNAANNVVPGATVKVTTNNNSIFTPPLLPVSDASGTYVGSIRSGQDKIDRVIQVSVSINNVVKTVSLPVVGINVTPGVVAPVSAFSVSLEKLTIANDGLDKSALTVIAVDASNNIVPGALVRVSTNNNSIFTPPTTAVTDATGSYVGVIKSGQDKSDRIIQAMVTVNGISRTVSLQVAGSALTLSVLPALSAPGAGATLTASLKDAKGVAIPGVTVTIAGSINTSFVTDVNGAAKVAFVTDQNGGTYNLSANGSGVQAISSYIVVSNNVFIVPPAVIPPGVSPSFALNPTVVSPNVVGSSANQAAFRFLILDGSNTPIPNVRVRFQKNGTGLGYDGVISSGALTILTNASGVASSSYAPGVETSPTNGVSFRACFSPTDFVSAADCPRFVDSRITVASSPVSISIGDNGLLEKGVGTYSQLFAVSVVDAAGRAAVGVPVSFRLDITHYKKGGYLDNYSLSEYLSSSTIGKPLPDLSTTPLSFLRRVICPNEDLNRSKVLDPSEDINDSGVLEPKSSDITIALSDASSGSKTDINGIVLLKATWLAKVATWEIFRIRVTTDVTGSESYAESSFSTNFVAGDDDAKLAAPFKVPPYGIGACRNPD